LPSSKGSREGSRNKEINKIGKEEIEEDEEKV
jgi:hypothetical protein